jgi:hypothetical protein
LHNVILGEKLKCIQHIFVKNFNVSALPFWHTYIILLKITQYNPIIDKLVFKRVKLEYLLPRLEHVQKAEIKLNETKIRTWIILCYRTATLPTWPSHVRGLNCPACKEKAVQFCAQISDLRAQQLILLSNLLAQKRYTIPIA